jgi:hypothetical protein
LLNREGLVFLNSPSEITITGRIPAKGGTPGNHQGNDEDVAEGNTPSCR